MTRSCHGGKVTSLPFDTDALALLLKQGRFGEVIADCETFLSRADVGLVERAKALQTKATALYLANPAWVREAIAYYRRALSAVDDQDLLLRAAIIVDLLRAYRDSQDQETFTELLQEYERLCGLCPEALQWRWRVMSHAGMNAASVGDLPTAAAFFQQAIEAADSDLHAGGARHNLAHTYILMGRPAEALPLMKQVELDDRYVCHLADTRARYHLAMGDFAAATDAVREGLAHPNVSQATQADLYMTQARIASLAGDAEEARRLSVVALDLGARSRNHWVIHEAHLLISEGVRK